jgi:transcriptional regulator with XRE-family HTH domain
MQTPQEMSVNQFVAIAGTNSNQELFEPAPIDESPTQRVERIYQQVGGPLIGWLGDEASKRGQTFDEMAETLGVTSGYFLQLCKGIRNIDSASQEFFVACARYLGVPPVVCKLLAGNLRMSDFLLRAESEEEAVDRSFRKMTDDPTARSLLPSDTSAFSTEAKRSLVLMYAESSGQDILGARRLPDIVYWLQRAAVLFDDAGYQAQLDLE